MSVVVEVSARKFVIPHECACCGSTPQVEFAASYTRRTGKRVIHEHTRSLNFPYCRRCYTHANRWTAATTALAVFITIGLIFAFIVGVNTSANVGIGVFVVSVALGIVVFAWQRSQARALCTQSCAVPGPAVDHLGWSGSVSRFAFESRVYAVKFADGNGRNLINVSMGLRRMLEEYAPSPQEIVVRRSPPPAGMVRVTPRELPAPSLTPPPDLVGDKPGYVYILVNPSIPGHVKIGQTTREPSERAKDLDGTGLPHPFAVVHSERVPDCVLAEKRVHRRLAEQRVNPRREFFEMAVADAIAIVREIADAERARFAEEQVRWAEQQQAEAARIELARTNQATVPATTWEWQPEAAGAVSSPVLPSDPPQEWDRRQPWSILMQLATIAALVFIAPIGIALAWWRQRWNLPIRIVATVASFAIFIAVVVEIATDKRAPPAPPPSAPSSSVVVTPTPAPVTPTAQGSATKKPKRKQNPQPVKQNRGGAHAGSSAPSGSGTATPLDPYADEVRVSDDDDDKTKDTDCSKSIANPKDRACVARYCAAHMDDARCLAE